MSANPSFYYSVYPGEFVPTANEQELKKHMPYADDDSSLCLSIQELNDLYTLDVSAPGLERNEFIVYGDDHSLFVTSYQDKKIIPDLRDFQRHIVLPADADAELTVAEYKNSVLHFYIPKTKYHGTHSLTRIVVY